MITSVPTIASPQRSPASVIRVIMLVAMTLGAIVTSAIVTSAIAQASTELVMVEESGCVYCERFNHEIADIYPKTQEGMRAPLRRIDIDDGWPADLAEVAPETLTPTFILVENGREVGRLRGYRGDEYFWFLIGELLAKLPDGDG